MKNNVIESYLEECAVIAKRSKCSRRKFGAIITDQNGVYLSGGYNGSARGVINCGEVVDCIKEKYDVEHYGGYDYCPAVHAEENAIINAARKGHAVEGGILFLNSNELGNAGRPCNRCKRAIMNAGIVKVYFKDGAGQTVAASVASWMKEDTEWILSK